MASTLYNDRWRSAVRHGVRSSAARLVPVLFDRFAPRTVVDVGAGEGWFSREFERLGCETTEVEGSWVTDRSVVQVDLARGPYPEVAGRFDLAISLEVAEHLTPAAAPAFVRWLCELSDTVVFSAAVPGQGGPGHVNEQWPSYWAALFDNQGYEGTGVLRWSVWADNDIEPWYRQNLLVFAPNLGAHRLEPDGCPPVVHPDMWRFKGHR